MYYIPLLPCVLCLLGLLAGLRKGWWKALIPLFLVVDAVVWTASTPPTATSTGSSSPGRRPVFRKRAEWR